MKKKVVIIIAVLVGFLFLKICIGRKSSREIEQPKKNEYVIEEKTWTKPIVTIRGITKQPPVSKKTLPVPIKEVAKTVTIPLPDNKEITLVIDKKGNIHKTRDFPEEVKPIITEWKPPFFAVNKSMGFSLAYSGRAYFCLSINIFNISERLYFGGDIGVNIDRISVKDWLLGVVARYRIWKSKPVFMTGGWNFIKKEAYVGLSLMW